MKKRLLAALLAIIVLLSTMSISANALASWTTASAPSGVDYSFVVFGDMQSITWTDNREGTTYVKSAFDWILDNKDSRKIEYVFGLGDTIDTLTTYSTNVVQNNGKTQNVNEWILVTDQFHRLDGIIPYTVTRGNHDDEGGYHKYVCTTAYTDQMTGFYYDTSKPATLGNSMANHYRKITIAGEKYLMLSLDYNAGDEVIAWANEVISRNPSYRVIASIHAYLNGTNSGGYGKLVSSNSSFLTGDIGAANADSSAQVNTAFDGKKFWTKIFSKHENMFMVLCGHDAIPTPVHNVRTGDKGNQVIEILTDTSKYDLEMGGNNYGANLMMVLNFKEASNQIYIEYLSPSRKAAGFSNYHLSGEQITLSYKDLTASAGIDHDISLPITKTAAATRFSTDDIGLRFKTIISEADLTLLKQRYRDVKVGTLITTERKLGTAELTHRLGIPGVAYIDVVADIDAPFDEQNGMLIFAGSISNVKVANIGTKYAAVGYISYVDGNGNTVYLYSESIARRSVSFVASAALADTSSELSAADRALLEELSLG